MIAHVMWQFTVIIGSHELQQISTHLANTFSKATSTILPYFTDRQLALVVEMLNIEYFRTHSTCCIALVKSMCKACAAS